MSSFVRAAFLVTLFKVGLSDQYPNTTFPAGAQYQSRQGFRNCPTHFTDPSLPFNRINVTVSENRLKDSVVVRLNITSRKKTCVIRPFQLQAYFDLQYSTIGNQSVLLLVVKKIIPYHNSSDGAIDFIVRHRDAGIRQINRIHISVESLQMALVSVPTHQRIVYRKALNYSRIFQPRVTDVIYASSSKLVYRLEILEPMGLEGFLNITPSSAIVYVQNTFLISKFRYTKTIISVRIFVEDPLLGKQWKFEETVKLKGEVRKEHCGSKSCSNSEHNTRALCTGRCGLGANESGCVWTVADNYISCSSDPKTCPDDTCDELESMNFDICPQDCVDSTKVGDRIFIDTDNRPASGRGIGTMPKLRNSVCICNSNRECVCRVLFASSLRTSPPEVFNTTAISTHLNSNVYKTNISTSTNDGSSSNARDSSICGGLCRLSIIFGCLVFCCVVVLLIWRSGCIRCIHRGFHKLPFGTHVDMQMTAINANYAQNEIFYRVQDIRPTTQQYKIDCDQKWEFPRSNLLFQGILGEGEFGTVVKAQALNIRGHTGYKTVAVKMLKPCASDVDMRDLVTELNLLKQVNNPNVIRLLGACSQKGPLLVIVEYCENGSLRKFLREHRKRPIYSDNTPTPNSERSLPYDDFAYHSKHNDLGPRDLLSFAWQICKGMHYLSTLKLVHRDLAARNVLVAEGLVIKISDFGLMRDIYEADAYKRTSKGRIPVKWIAIESLYDNVYTAKSDVWSFAILLWEIVTMGATPYPGVTSERLYNILKTGYRMIKPDGCSDELYAIMTRCWSEKPSDRPSFQELCEIFECMLKRNIEYLDLTELQQISQNDEEEEDELPAVQMVKMRLLNSNEQSSSTPSNSRDNSRTEKLPVHALNIKSQASCDEESYFAC